MSLSIDLHLPKVHSKEPAKTSPPKDFLIGTWHVTHSSLPLWKKKRNVKITYKPLPSSAETDTMKLDDLVEYQTLTSETIKSVHGIDTPSPGNPGSWDWRGKGLLVIASSHWECLGHGSLADGNQWVVTYFAKTLFTPPGIDIYSRNKDGLEVGFVDRLLAALGGFGIEEITRLVGDMFEIPRS
ncbi:hypothetical protein N7495_003686 [Penicillium taxi]|uniref:uncharacterized protein n=1 Tax=Penicillium taxi TaxID=168475 RepID=UPI0025452AEA|nr:uncharacterized protein N7495_003686 [Penicillium taxi]KAJ5898942.1 hypothetical protein N7495_003686 [Penicillium taxi]